VANSNIIDRPSDADMAQCVHCGFCLQQCPTYLQLGSEADSPRGRIHLIRALADERIEPTGPLVKHLDLCLQCRACETACPSSVPFGRIMEDGRAMLVQQGRLPFAWNLRVFALRQLFPHQRRLRLLFGLLRLYQRTGLQRIVRATGLLRLLRLADAESMLPNVPAARGGRVQPAQIKPPTSVGGPEQHTCRVALLTGCVMPILYARTHEATVRVLERSRCSVVNVPAQVCCGALNLHAGDRRTAREQARKNIDAFLATDVDAIIVNSAGCGSTMKEYAELLEHDAAYAEKARRFVSLVRDVNEYLAELPFAPPKGPLPYHVTYQDSCHLVHAQKVKNAPRKVLRAIEGLHLVEMSAPDRCCGSAGVYSFAQREMSLRVLDDKMADIASTLRQAQGGEPFVIATANPGCMMQLEAGLRRAKLPGRIVHVVELLDEAYAAEES
jgi:glycolate oxidase iron-sulfur subunit